MAENERAPGAAETLTQWRVAERALSTAIANREAAEVAAEVAEIAERAAIKTADAAKAALAAATEAEETARMTADAARAASIAARGEVTKRQGQEADATAAEGAAHVAYRQAEDRARSK
jgi:hypothetical protein